MSDLDVKEKWLNAVFSNQVSGNPKAAFERYEAFLGKTGQQIIGEFSEGSEKKFKEEYARLLLSYTAHLQKSLPPHQVKEHVDVVRSFFNFYRLPLGFGFKAHVQFFMK